MTSRIARKPIEIPNSIEVNIVDGTLIVKSSKDSRNYTIPNLVKVAKQDNNLTFTTVHGSKEADMLAGTTRASINNILQGLAKGFERKLTLIGVGYKAQVQGKKLILNLGFSHPINYQLPEAITAEMPSQTEIIIKGVDKQLVGQVAPEIRGFRPPEPYKGKGVRYADEKIIRKEGKKK